MLARIEQRGCPWSLQREQGQKGRLSYLSPCAGSICCLLSFPGQHCYWLVLESLLALLCYSTTVPFPRNSLKALFVSPFSNGGDRQGFKERSRNRAEDSPLARVQWSLLGRTRSYLSAENTALVCPRRAYREARCQQEEGGAVQVSSAAQCCKDSTAWSQCPAPGMRVGLWYALGMPC